MFLYSLLHSLSELPELVLAPAVAHAELVVEGLGVRLGQADRADVGLQAELGVEEEQGEVVVVVPSVQAGMFLQGGQMLTVRLTAKLFLALSSYHNSVDFPLLEWILLVLGLCVPLPAPHC